MSKNDMTFMTFFKKKYGFFNFFNLKVLIFGQFSFLGSFSAQNLRANNFFGHQRALVSYSFFKPPIGYLMIGTFRIFRTL